MSTGFKDNKKLSIALLISASLVLPACENLQSMMNSLGGDTYLADSTDACYSERQQLVDSGSYFDKEFTAGLMSAVSGAAIGAIASSVAGGDVTEGVITGVITGVGVYVATQLASKYMESLQQQSSDPAEMVQTANSDIGAEGSQIRETTAAFNKLMNCREAEAGRIRADLAAGRIDRGGARERMAALEKKIDEDLARGREIGAKVDERSDAFVTVYNDIAADNQAQQIVVDPQGRRERAKFVPPSSQRRIEGDTTPPLTVPPREKDLVARMGSSTKDTIEARGDLKGAFQVAEARKQTMTAIPS